MKVFASVVEYIRFLFIDQNIDSLKVHFTLLGGLYMLVKAPTSALE